MSLIQYLLDDPRYHHHRHFGNLFEDETPYILVHRRNPAAPNQRPSSSEVAKDDNNFKVNLDVQQFLPEEISVKVDDDKVVCIEGKHEERQDGHGFVSRHFVRKFALPKEYDIKQLQSTLTSDGVLVVTAPKVAAANEIQYRQIPIVRTGQPAKQVQSKTEEEKKHSSCKKA